MHCWLAKMIVGVTDKTGAATTDRVTPTMKELAPILKVTVPVYIPAGRCALMFEAVLATLYSAPAFNELPFGLLISPLAHTAASSFANHTPTTASSIMRV